MGQGGKGHYKLGLGWIGWVPWARDMARKEGEVGCGCAVTLVSGKFLKCENCVCVVLTLINHNFLSFENLKKFTTTNILRVV